MIFMIMILVSGNITQVSFYMILSWLGNFQHQVQVRNNERPCSDRQLIELLVLPVSRPKHNKTSFVYTDMVTPVKF